MDDTAAKPRKAKALGINHVVLEVGDIDEALAFYGAIFDFELRGRGETNAFIDLGDQFIQLSKERTQGPDGKRHFGFVVDDRDAVRARLAEVGAEMLERGLNFRDPWGNRVEIVAYSEIQFSKTPEVLNAMGAGDIAKTPDALDELAKKGMAPAA
jgi:lactoylglutathione lyase